MADKYNSIENIDALRHLMDARDEGLRTPGAPSLAISSFSLFSRVEHENLKRENPELPFNELGRLAGIRWRNMSAEEREPYERMTREFNAPHKLVWRQKMGLLRPLIDERDEGLRTPGAQLLSVSSFWLYATVVSEDLKRENPWLSFNGLWQLAGVHWVNMSAEEREPYERMAREFDEPNVKFIERQEMGLDTN